MNAICGDFSEDVFVLYRLRPSWKSVFVLMDYPHSRANSFKVTGHPFWRFAENRYCALNISSILIKISPNIRQCMQNVVKL